MKRIAFLACSVLFLGGCRSSNEDVHVDLSTIPCICGEPEAAFDGCSHPACLSGEGNPENPDCVCAPMKIGEK